MRIPTEEGQTVIDGLLREQHLLTAVERFARKHDGRETGRAKHYRDLIPLTAPQAGAQYAFEVDLDKCTGCKACVAACHSLNGLDKDEAWRSVGVLRGITDAGPVQQFVTTACHHCVDPGCLNGCPVLAYHKDPGTGIVRHLDDQCIGCQYCTWTCPYEVPRYSASRGIVRKCDMCSSRLGAGEAPACVQACPNEAIRITIVEKAEVCSTTPAGAQLVAGAPDSHITRPSTRYRSRQSNVAMQADNGQKNQPPHWPLILMLVLTQLAVGMIWLGTVFSWLSGNHWMSVAVASHTDHAAGVADITRLEETCLRAWLATSVGLLLCGLGIGAAHLGRPLQAWRTFLGWRTSWLSRELIAFGGFTFLALTLLLRTQYAWAQPVFRLLSIEAHWVVVAFAGLSALACSAMIYVATRRELWGAALVFPRFLGTAALLGGAATSCGLAILIVDADLASAPIRDILRLLCGLLVCVAVAKLGWEAGYFRCLSSNEASLKRRSAQLMVGEKACATAARFLCGITGGIMLPAALFLSFPTTGFELVLITSTALVVLVAGEVLERYLFFTTVVFPTMPGGRE